MIFPIDHLLQRGAPDAIALEGRFGAISYARLEAMTARLAHMLERRGLEPGSRVACWLPKGVVSALLPLAAARAGHVYVPINPLLKRGQVAHILADAQAALLVSAPARIASLEPGDVGANLILLEEDAALAIAQDDSQMELGPSGADPNGLCEILYTSGSTGLPKGVMLSHANLWIGAQSVATYLRLAADDRTLAVLPLSFDYGQSQLFSTWWAGGCVVPLDYLVARDVVKASARYGVTTLAGVPPLWTPLVEAQWPDAARGALRRITNSGGALSRALVERLRATLPTTDIYAMYGLTEAFRSTYLPPDLIATHPTSMGFAIPDAEILVVRPDGSLTADGEPGELVHCGPLVAQGYWRDPMRTAERFRPAPVHASSGGRAVWSGDTVKRESDGLHYFVARDDAMIKSAGNRISPTEIEEAALAVPGIVEAIVLGRPDDRLGQAIVLLVRHAHGSVDPVDALTTALRHALPNFMQPAEIRSVETFPRNPNGKLDRAAIARDMLDVTA